MTTPANAQRHLDGQPATTPIVMDPGAHALMASAAGYEPSMHSLQISEGEHRMLEITLTPIDTPAPAETAAHESRA